MGCVAHVKPWVSTENHESVSHECQERMRRTKAVLDEVARESEQLADWLYFVYVPSLAEGGPTHQRLFDAIETQCQQANHGSDRLPIAPLRSLIPLIVGGFALKMGGSHELISRNFLSNEPPTFTRSYLINALVEHDCYVAGDNSEAYKQKQRESYRIQWFSWQHHIQSLVQFLLQWDQAARTLFKNKLG